VTGNREMTSTAAMFVSVGGQVAEDTVDGGDLKRTASESIDTDIDP